MTSSTEYTIQKTRLIERFPGPDGRVETTHEWSVL
jgi:hypothetical protein